MVRVIRLLDRQRKAHVKTRITLEDMISEYRCLWARASVCRHPPPPLRLWCFEHQSDNCHPQLSDTSGLKQDKPHTHICRQTHTSVPKVAPDSGLAASFLQQLFKHGIWHDPAVKSSGEDKRKTTKVKYCVLFCPLKFAHTGMFSQLFYYFKFTP